MAKKKDNKEKKSLRDRIVLIVTIVVMAPICFVIIQNVRHSISIYRQICSLNREAEVYQKQIEKDSLLLERIKYDEGLEEYARENYYMQRKGERLFIIND
ncbi:MAG: septum formation initiator [Rikenellaceae bacterium]